MLKTLHDIYTKDETFTDFFAHDLDEDAAWFNNSEFARYHDIQGRKILSVFTKNIRDKSIDFRFNEQNPDSVTKGSGVLYVRVKDVKNIKAESQIRLDGALYTVAEVELILDNLWRVVLEANK